jgi:EmrB/QacA subfamily drug resistance transporter
LSPTIDQLIIFRIIQGIGAAMMIPGSLSIINTSFESHVRGKVIGYWSGFAGGIAALGPFLGGWLVQTLGWEAIFFINVPLGILAFIMTMRFVPTDTPHQTAKLDWLGTLYILISLTGIAYGLIRGQTAGWDNLVVILSLVIGVVTLFGFMFAEKTAPAPLVPLHIFRSPLVLGSNLVTLFLYSALNGVIFFLVLNLQQIQQYPPLLAGISMLPSILIITFFSGWGGALADKIGPRIPMIVGPFIVGCAMTLLAFSGLRQNYFLSYFPGLVLFGIGMSIVIAPLTKSALAVEERYSGAASGVNNDIARIAALLAVALFGAIMLGIFSSHLTGNLAQTNLNQTQQQQILQQKDNLGNITIPNTFTAHQQSVARGTIDAAFVSGFRWIMGINAALAFLSSLIAVKYIRAPGKSKE